MMTYRAAIAALALMAPVGALAEEPVAQAEAASLDSAVQTQGELGQSGDPLQPSPYQTIGNSVAMAAANAVYAQQQANVTYQTATTIGVAEEPALDTATQAVEP